jgi:hypothetical protein
MQWLTDRADVIEASIGSAAHLSVDDSVLIITRTVDAMKRAKESSKAAFERAKRLDGDTIRNLQQQVDAHSDALVRSEADVIRLKNEKRRLANAATVGSRPIRIGAAVGVIAVRSIRARMMAQECFMRWFNLTLDRHAARSPTVPSFEGTQRYHVSAFNSFIADRSSHAAGASSTPNQRLLLDDSTAPPRPPRHGSFHHHGHTHHTHHHRSGSGGVGGAADSLDAAAGASFSSSRGGMGSCMSASMAGPMEQSRAMPNPAASGAEAPDLSRYSQHVEHVSRSAVKMQRKSESLRERLQEAEAAAARITRRSFGACPLHDPLDLLRSGQDSPQTPMVDPSAERLSPDPRLPLVSGVNPTSFARSLGESTLNVSCSCSAAEDY